MLLPQVKFNVLDAMSTSYGTDRTGLGRSADRDADRAYRYLGHQPAGRTAGAETLANGVNLGLGLGDGTQVQFASTARLATFLYSLGPGGMTVTINSASTATRPAWMTR